jgi:hypothetical protein
MKEVRSPLWLRQVAACSLSLCSIGCRDALGPEKMPVTTVDGRVMQGVTPISRGWIEFVPVDGTVGRMRSARVLKDGTFHATKVPVGVVLIRLVNVDIGDKDVRQTFGAFTSPIRRTITDQPGNRLEIDIIMEVRKLIASRKREGGPPGEPLPSR